MTDRRHNFRDRLDRLFDALSGDGADAMIYRRSMGTACVDLARWVQSDYGPEVLPRSPARREFLHDAASLLTTSPVLGPWIDTGHDPAHLDGATMLAALRERLWEADYGEVPPEFLGFASTPEEEAREREALDASHWLDTMPARISDAWRTFLEEIETQVPKPERTAEHELPDPAFL